MTKSEAIQTLVRHQEQLVGIRDANSGPEGCMAECLLALSELAREQSPDGFAAMRYANSKKEIED